MSLGGGAAAAAGGTALLVRFADGATAPERAAALAAVGGRLTGEIAGLGVSRVRASDPDAVARLEASGAVDWAERDETVRLELTPNDPLYNTDPYTGLGQWGIKKIQADRAWDTVTGSSAVTVAVIDTGIDPLHPDLASTLVSGARFVSSPSAGCTATSNDDNTHGTHVAGIVGAAGNNGQGIAGVAYGVRLMPIKALDCTGTGTVGDIAQAIVYAVNNGARIINVSLGSPSDSQTIRAAVQAAASRNVLIVAAAGNCGLGGGSCDVTNEVSYPAAYAEVLAVAATDVDDTRAPFSTQANYVDVAAPGRRIVSTAPTYATYLSRRGASQSYTAISGTSQATPFVAGTAALLLSRQPSLSATELVARLKSTADRLGAAGTNTSFGSGRINALTAVTSSGTTTPTPPASAVTTYGALYDLANVPRAIPFGTTTTMPVRLTNISSFTWNATGPTAVSLGYRWTDPVGQVVVADGLRTPLAADIPPGGSAVVQANVLAPPTAGPYTIKFDLFQLGVGFFFSKGVRTGDLILTANGGFGATYTVGASTASTVAANVPVNISVAVQNTGARTWSAAGANPVRLSYHWLRPDGTVAVWDGARAPLSADVPQNGSANLTLAVVPPATFGAYILRLDLVQEGITWFSGQGVPTRDLPFNVTSGLSPTWSVPAQPGAVFPGSKVTVPITVRNDGIAPWAAGGPTPVRLAAHIVDPLGNTVLWDGPRTLLTADVPPGQSVTTSLTIPAPVAPGIYRVRGDLVQEGVTWFSTQGAPVAEVSLTVVGDFRATIQVPAGPIARTNPTVQVSVTNTSAVTWPIDGSVVVSLAPHWYDAQGNVLVWDGPRTKLTAPLGSGQTAALPVSLGAVPPGAAQLMIDVVADGLRWFNVGTRLPVAFN
ncbi:MAG: hypothetical protein FJ034_07700 [Chloroflexi bacterium]|nr:hypothetical protein [Chloroflexota bacterium]